jgi:hypothetical protein
MLADAAHAYAEVTIDLVRAPYGGDDPPPDVDRVMLYLHRGVPPPR